MAQLLVKRTVNSAASAGDVVLWQEIAHARYKQAVRELGPGWGHHFPEREGEPISWRKADWEYVTHGFEFGHGGMSGVLNSRHIIWVDLRHLKTGLVIRFCNAHPVSGAWRNPLKTRKPERRKLSVEFQKNLTARTTEWVAEGRTVVGGGDYNMSMKQGPPGMTAGPLGPEVGGRKVAYLTPNSPDSKVIDWLWKVDGDTGTLDVVARNLTLADNPSDHRGRKAVLRPSMRR